MSAADRRRQIEDLCHSALERDPAARAAFVATACGSDEALRREVEALLAHAQTAEGFLATPLEAVAAQSLREAPASWVGRAVGPYQIRAHLGSGGMGEVYRAQDTILGRDVAIKILLRAFPADTDRRARIDREARLLAALNHPNIGAIYGVERTPDGTPALILELVQGPTLADRIAEGPIPIPEVLTFAKQIADALEAAHEKGIVHRDLKPDNIKITPAGVVKVLDFGLAKLSGATDSALSQAPTLNVGGTREGVIAGTAAYMSPEQARGQSVEKRCDIWAFGVVLFEMLSGKRLFVGASTSDVLAGVLTTEPDWSVLPVATPPAIRTLLHRCLTRDVKRRLQAIGEARIAIEDDLAHPSGTGDLTLVGHSTRHRLTGTVAAAAVVLSAASVFAALYVGRGQRTPTAAPPTYVEINTPPTSDPMAFAMSPDGRRLAFVGRSGDVERLWIRSLEESSEAQPLSGTEGARAPFWSPDSRSIGFFTKGQLKRIDLGGTAPQVLVGASETLGGTWNADGVIVFGSLAGPLYRVSESGGEAIAITTVDRPQDSHRWPFFLPDGRHLLYMSGLAGRTADVYLLTLGSPGSRRLIQADSATAYGFGYLFYLREGALVAHRFNAESQEVADAPIPVASHVGIRQNRSEAAYSVSATGVVAYRASTKRGRQLIWLDRSGKELGTLGEYAGVDVGGLEFEPHGRRVAFSWTWTEGNTDVHLMETDQGTAKRFTLGAKADFNSVWSPDGDRIVFSSDRNGSYDLYQKLSTGAGPESAILESPLGKFPSDWSPDGRFLLYWQLDLKTKFDLWVLPMDGDGKPGKPFPFVEAESNQSRGRFSPNGKWVAYQSDESGRSEIYVKEFLGSAEGKWLVSTNGGTSPRWARSGSELYYIAPDGKLMTAAIRPKDETFVAEPPTKLFQTPPTFRRYGGPSYVTSEYDVTADGRFLMMVDTEEASATPINLILNWSAALKR